MLIENSIQSTDVINRILSSNDKTIYMDMEFMCYESRYDICLVQIMHNNEIFLFDTSSCIILKSLDPLLRNQNITKVFFACKQDILALVKNLSIIPNNILDLQIHAMLCGHYYGTPGYKTALYDFLGIDISKGCTRSNWYTRPLTDEQIAYAINDVRYLYSLHVKLNETLNDRGYMQYALAECKEFLESIPKSITSDKIKDQLLDPLSAELHHAMKLWLKVRSRELSISPGLCAISKWIDCILHQKDTFRKNWRYSIFGNEIEKFITGDRPITFTCSNGMLSTQSI